MSERRRPLFLLLIISDWLQRLATTTKNERTLSKNLATFFLNRENSKVHQFCFETEYRKINRKNCDTYFVSQKCRDIAICDTRTALFGKGLE
ncbi:hypothetical protein L596_002802 [Steinernema carpocapsae]|uniref:Secreted protein n=1 Tax=Steinernema carpocapsae TaxID=34508 RepID=A0A4U8UUD7_STECR|nr:hypothetical protein L596_002802 [Steinernema carpocapsae]